MPEISKNRADATVLNKNYNVARFFDAKYETQHWVKKLPNCFV
tara:strand:+ start:651 stop:779 length:129 start_codon:yes stop_codon:yes gene_type:complete